MMKVLAVVCGLALFSSSCATMFHDTNHRVIATSSIKSAKLYHNHRFIGKGTASTFIEAHGSDVLSGKHPKCETNEQLVRKNMRWGWFLIGNCIFNACWGILVDLASGAWRGLAQKQYDVTPHCG